MFLTGLPQSRREFRRAIRAEQHPELPAIAEDLDEMIAHHRRRVIPHAVRRVRWLFADCGWLAFIRMPEQGDATIFFHSLLNNCETPSQVLEHIVIHELIHLLVPGRDVDGKWTGHPPEFWEQERRFSPLRHEAMVWLHITFWNVVREDKKREGMRVLRRWRRLDPYGYAPWSEALRRRPSVQRQDQGVL